MTLHPLVIRMRCRLNWCRLGSCERTWGGDDSVSSFEGYLSVGATTRKSVIRAFIRTQSNARKVQDQE